MDRALFHARTRQGPVFQNYLSDMERKQMALLPGPNGTVIDTSDMEVENDAAPETATTTDGAASDEVNLSARLAEAEANAEKWKAQSRKHETEKKALLKGQTSESAAPSEEIQALRAEWARDKAQDKLDAAAAKAGVDVSDILDYVAVDKFINDGQVDTEAINEFVGKFAGKAAKPQFKQGIGVGPHAGGKSQLTKSDLKNMSDEAIVKAMDDGLFDNLLGRSK